MPQMFLVGRIIPISHSTGVIAILVKIMPLTYLTDLARGAFYFGEPTYNQVVLHNLLYNKIVLGAFCLHTGNMEYYQQLDDGSRMS